MHLMRAATVAALVISSSFSVFAGTASAELRADNNCPGFDDPFATPDPVGCVSMGNNFTHTYQFAGVRTDIINSFRSIAGSVYDQQTDLVVYERDPADVVVMDNNYGRNGVLGWTHCPPGAQQGFYNSMYQSTRWCYGQYLRFNLYSSIFFDTDIERRDLACHEFGHTVALRHVGDDNTCMNDDSGRVPGNLRNINSTEVGQINYWY